MNLLKIVRLALKHIKLVLIIPLLLVILVFILSFNKPKNFKSNTTIYTGLASGYSIETANNSKIDYFTANNAFDNLINIIKSRETLKETSIRLLAQHLFLEGQDKSIISKDHFDEIHAVLPDSLIRKLKADSYEGTVENIRNHLSLGYNNHIYRLLNFNHRYYSIEAISEIEVTRISSSDLIKVSFESDDPGICKQTLLILCEVFIEQFKSLKQNETSNVVEYFKNQLRIAADDLKQAENNLLMFNKENSIINYYEQTRHIAEYKEDIDLYYQQERMVLVSAQASIKRTEEQINSSFRIKLKSNEIIDKRKKLSDLTSQIALNEVNNGNNKDLLNTIVDLELEGDKIKNELENHILQLYDLKNTTEGVSQEDLLRQWLKSVISFEESKARIKIYEEKINDFEQTYKRFAPLGATIKRIEREIDICEREYLVILKSLNDSKLKQQNIELSSDIKIIDHPFFPIAAESSKQKLLLIAAAILGLFIVAVMIFLFEYFDNSIKEPVHLSENKDLELLGIYPNLNSINKTVDVEGIIDSQIESMVQNIRVQSGVLSENRSGVQDKASPFIILLFSMNEKEGVSTISTALSKKMRAYDMESIFINCRNKEDEQGGNDDATQEIQETQENQERASEAYIDYRIDNSYFKMKSAQDLMALASNPFNAYDFVFIEIPALIGYQLPVDIVKTADLSILFCRANRTWMEKDESALKYYKKIYKSKVHLVLNGMQIEDMEPFIGEIPKQRSPFRKTVKKLLQFEFSRSNQF